jgi:hypothetical protein
MATIRFPARRLIVAGGCAAAIAAGALLAGTAAPAPRSLAQCPGGINANLFSEGAPVTSNCAPAVQGGPGGGAPSEGTLSACSGIPGCLSNALYGPGNVIVPRTDTTVHQSQ